MAQGIEGHTWIKSFSRVLNNGYTAKPFDFQESRRAIIERAGEYDAYHSRTIGDCCRAKYRLTDGPAAVLHRTAHKMNMLILQQHVQVRRSHIHPSMLYNFAVRGMDGFERTRSA